MMHIWGRLSRVVMACALSVLFLGGTGKTILAAPAISFTDIAGREVQLDKLPKTFVVANYIANFLMVGGAGSLDKVVGMTFDGWEETRYGEYVVYTETFPKLKAIPSIGGYHDNILDSEKILSLRPDVLLIGRSQFADNNQKIDIFEKAGIKVVVLDYHAMKVENHTKSTMILGQLLDREAVAKEQCDVYASALEDVYRKVAALPDSAKHKTVYMELGNKGIGEYGNSYNKDVLWGAILKNLGADNLAENATQPYAPLDTEFVLASNPQLIVIGGGIWRNALALMKACAHRNAPRRFTERALSNSSAVISMTGLWKWARAALLTSTWTAPCRSVTRRKASLTASACLKSVWMKPIPSGKALCCSTSRAVTAYPARWKPSQR